MEDPSQAGGGIACLSLSAPLGIEKLRRPEAQPLIDAWHRGARELPEHFRVWASVPDENADVIGLNALLADDRFVGLQPGGLRSSATAPSCRPPGGAGPPSVVVGSSRG